MFFGRQAATIFVVCLGVVGLLVVAHNPEMPQVTYLLIGGAGLLLGGVLCYTMALEVSSKVMQMVLMFLTMLCLCTGLAFALGALGSLLLVDPFTGR